jgi:predicted kinase
MVDMLRRGSVEAEDEVPTSTLLLMAGFAGAGKTTLARWLKDQLGWRVLNKDDFKFARLAKGEDPEKAGWNAFLEMLKEIEHETMKRGESVIVDTSNEKPFIFNDVKKIQEQLEMHNIRVHLEVVLCVATQETRTQRLYKRGSVFAPYVAELPTILDDSQWTEKFQHLLVAEPELLRQFQHIIENPVELEHFQPFSSNNTLILNTNPSLQDYASHVLQTLRENKKY